jgi:transposase-like protein
MTATRASLLGWVHACGVAALDVVFREEAEAVAGPKGQHRAGRTHHHWGTTPTELTLGGRRIQVPRPRVRGREGGEVTLPAVAAFRGRDPLTARVLEQILLGVSTRGYAASLEAGPVGVPSRATSRSAVSRTLIRRTREQVATQLTRRLEGLDLVALFGDGVVVAGQTVIVLLGITRDGRKEPLGVSVGSTENAAVCTQLLQDLLARGLPVEGRLLCVIDGGQGLRRALQDVFGDVAVIQRCQVHKRRNLQALLPQGRQAYVRAALGRAYRAASADAARRQLRRLAAWLDQNGHGEAAASLREGLEETLTVLKVGPPLGPQRRAESQPLVEGDRLQAGLDHRPHPDQPDAVGDQGAPIPGARIGDPHRGEAVVLEQVEQVPGVAPIGLRLAHDHGPDLRGLADQHRVAELVHEGVKPLGVARRLDADRHGRRQRAVEPLHGVAFVGELLLDELAGAGVENCDLLRSRVQITSDEYHDRGLLFLRAVALGWSEGSSSARPFS